MNNSELWIYKYLVTQSGYFRLVVKLALGMGIVERKLLLCHAVSYQSNDESI